jgi:hypothetical protein
LRVIGQIHTLDKQKTTPDPITLPASVMTTLTKKEILDKLLQLDLSEYPHEDIHALIQKLGKYAVVVTTFRPGQVFVRARVNCNFEVFSKPQDLSYKPAEFNNTYQRSSTPATTMFYGALIPESVKKGELDNARITGCCEVSKLIRDKSISEGEQIITFGKWVVKKEIHVASIVHQSDYFNGNTYLKQMADDYNDFIKAYSKEIVDDSMLISEFFANQFSKVETQNDYDYMLSAIYTERMTKMKPAKNIEIAGVLYPSVRTEGKGFNVAITPYHADNSLKLVAVSECTIYKKGTLTVSDNDKQAVVKLGSKEFKLKQITDPNVHLGREVVYKILNGEIKINPAD